MGTAANGWGGSMPADDQSELQPEGGPGGRRSLYENTQGDGSVSDARRRRLVAIARLKAAEDGAMGLVFQTLTDIAEAVDRKTGKFKYPPKERRLAVTALGKLLLVEPRAEEPNVLIDQRRAEVHIHHEPAPLDAAETARILGELGIQLPQGRPGPTPVRSEDEPVDPDPASPEAGGVPPS